MCIRDSRKRARKICGSATSPARRGDKRQQKCSQHRAELLCNFSAEFQFGLTVVIRVKRENFLVVDKDLVGSAVTESSQFELNLLVLNLTCLLYTSPSPR